MSSRYAHHLVPVPLELIREIQPDEEDPTKDTLTDINAVFPRELAPLYDSGLDGSSPYDAEAENNLEYNERSLNCPLWGKWVDPNAGPNPEPSDYKEVVGMAIGWVRCTPDEMAFMWWGAKVWAYTRKIIPGKYWGTPSAEAKKRWLTEFESVNDSEPEERYFARRVEYGDPVDSTEQQNIDGAETNPQDLAVPPCYEGDNDGFDDVADVQDAADFARIFPIQYQSDDGMRVLWGGDYDLERMRGSAGAFARLSEQDPRLAWDRAQQGAFAGVYGAPLSPLFELYKSRGAAKSVSAKNLYAYGDFHGMGFTWNEDGWHSALKLLRLMHFFTPKVSDYGFAPEASLYKYQYEGNAASYPYFPIWTTWVDDVGKYGPNEFMQHTFDPQVEGSEEPQTAQWNGVFAGLIGFSKKQVEEQFPAKLTYTTADFSDAGQRVDYGMKIASFYKEVRTGSGVVESSGNDQTEITFPNSDYQMRGGGVSIDGFSVSIYLFKDPETKRSSYVPGEISAGKAPTFEKKEAYGNTTRYTLLTPDPWPPAWVDKFQDGLCAFWNDLLGNIGESGAFNIRDASGDIVASKPIFMPQDIGTVIVDWTAVE